MLAQQKEMPNLDISGNKIVNNEAGKCFGIISSIIKTFVSRK
jgi:hypothetical protein